MEENRPMLRYIRNFKTVITKRRDNQFPKRKQQEEVLYKELRDGMDILKTNKLKEKIKHLPCHI